MIIIIKTMRTCIMEYYRIHHFVQIGYFFLHIDTKELFLVNV
jgi:hypothetical protein